MPPSHRELAVYGGWYERALAGGVHKWGDPRIRLQEIDCTVASDLLLPEPTWRDVQRGVPYRAINVGSANVTIKHGDSTIITCAPTVCCELILGSGWLGRTLSQPEFGPAQPALIFDLVLGQNASDIDLLERAVTLFGYDGSAPAAIICRVQGGVVIGATSESVRAITTGTSYAGVSWASGSQWMLVVEPGGTVGGWGGYGGAAGVSGTGGSAGGDGGDAGQAIRSELPMTAVVDGVVLGGGGGGGGGGGSTTVITQLPGGGGGGRGANMLPGGVLIGSPGGNSQANQGTSGGTIASGAGGAGVGGGGDGGNGGGAGAAGSNGTAGTAGGGTGGAGAEAISYSAAAGAPTVLSGGANILGGQVEE